MSSFNDLEKPGTRGIPNYVNVHPQHVAKIQGEAEIVKNFKILIMHFSAIVSLHIDVQTKVMTFEVGLHGVLGSQRMHVC